MTQEKFCLNFDLDFTQKASELKPIIFSTGENLQKAGIRFCIFTIILLLSATLLDV